MAVVDLQAYYTRALSIITTALEGTAVNKPHGCVSAWQSAPDTEPCSVATLGKRVVLEDLWNLSNEVLNILNVNRPSLATHNARQAADWCIAVVEWLDYKLWSTGVNPTFFVRPGSQWITKSLPATRSDCAGSPTSGQAWASNCWPGEPRPDLHNARNDTKWSQLPLGYEFPGKNSIYLNLPAEMRGGSVAGNPSILPATALSYMMPVSHTWGAGEAVRIEDLVTRHGPAPRWTLWKHGNFSNPKAAYTAGADEVYPVGLQRISAGELRSAAPKDRLRAIFGQTWGIREESYIRSTGRDPTWVPTAKGQVAFCVAILEGYLNYDRRNLSTFVMDSLMYYTGNHLQWYASSSPEVVGMDPGEVQQAFTAMQSERVQAAAAQAGQATGMIASAVFSPVIGAAVAGAMTQLSRGAFAFFGRMARGTDEGPMELAAGGCIQPLFRRVIGGGSMGLQCTAPLVRQRFNPAPPPPPQSASKINLPTVAAVGAGVAVGLLGAKLLTRKK